MKDEHHSFDELAEAQNPEDDEAAAPRPRRGGHRGGPRRRRGGFFRSLLPVLLVPVLPVALLLPLPVPAELLSLLVSLPALVMESWPRLLLWLEGEPEPLSAAGERVAFGVLAVIVGLFAIAGALTLTNSHSTEEPH